MTPPTPHPAPPVTDHRTNGPDGPLQRNGPDETTGSDGPEDGSNGPAPGQRRSSGSVGSVSGTGSIPAVLPFPVSASTTPRDSSTTRVPASD